MKYGDCQSKGILHLHGKLSACDKHTSCCLYITSKSIMDVFLTLWMHNIKGRFSLFINTMGL